MFKTHNRWLRVRHSTHYVTLALKPLSFISLTTMYSQNKRYPVCFCLPIRVALIEALGRVVLAVLAMAFTRSSHPSSHLEMCKIKLSKMLIILSVTVWGGESKRVLSAIWIKKQIEHCCIPPSSLFLLSLFKFDNYSLVCFSDLLKSCILSLSLYSEFLYNIMLLHLFRQHHTIAILIIELKDNLA